MAQVYRLSGRDNRWTFSDLGGRLLTWDARDGSAWRRLVRGDPVLKPSEDGYRSCVMFPWVNRIGGDHWSLEGRRVPVDTSRERGNLHGLVFDAPFEVLEAEERRLRLRHRLEPGPYYPCPVECALEYAIGSRDGAEALEVSIVSTNLAEDDQIAYVTTGLHPYFLNPFGGAVDAIELFCAAAAEFAVDDRLIPTGLIDVTPEHDFRRPRPLLKTFFDNGFVLDASASPVAELALRNFNLSIHAGENCSYLQIYIPPDRDEIALEPQSGGADAFRFHQYGLRRLRPGQNFRTAMTFLAQFA